MRFILPIMVLVTFCGCGPSNREKETVSKLEAASEKIESLNVENAKHVRELESELTKTSRELAASKQQLESDRSEITNQLARIKQLEHPPELALPEYKISGEVFIVTKGGQNFKLGLVPIMIFDAASLKANIKERQKLQTNSLNLLDPQLKRAEEEMNNAEKAVDVIFETDSKERLSDFSERMAEALKARNLRRDEYIQICFARDKLLSGDFYFSQLPPPLKVSKSNSDGRFSISLRTNSDMVMGASAKRDVGDKTEIYYWLLPLEHGNTDTSMEISLSNDNLTSAQGGSLLISTP